jgi:hypothetical protein
MFKGQQAQAVQFLDSWFYESNALEGALKGYAGVGKTWLVGAWVATVLERKPRIRITVLAPTNKALDVLREKCGHLDVGFATVDSFLGNRIKKNDDGETEKSRGKGQENPDLLIVDEGSMIKEEYHTDLRRRRVRTLYVLDPAQLPPIQEDLSTTANVQPSFEMTEVVRYDGAIIKAATFLRERIQSGQTFILQDLMEFRDSSGQLSVIKMGKLYDWALTAYQKGMDGRIVAFTNADVDAHNAIMHNALFPNDELFGIGERVLVNETFELPNTDPASEETDMLYNGEILEVKSCTINPTLACGVVTYKVGVRDYELDVALDARHAAQVHQELTNSIWQMRREGKPESEVRKLLELRKPLNKLAPLRHCYSNTVHKSQGSTYDISFVDWSSVYRCPDRARMMYVALTRASKHVVLAAK